MTPYVVLADLGAGGGADVVATTGPLAALADDPDRAVVVVGPRAA